MLFCVQDYEKLKDLIKMRYEINRHQLAVAYGDDHATGIFLSVGDTRLEYNPGANQEVNKITEKINGGNGVYFDLHTGISGFGYKVSKSAMAIFMNRYGVPVNHIEMLTGVSIGTEFRDFDLCADDCDDEWSEEEEGEILKIEAKKNKNSQCSSCNMAEAKKICSRCKAVYYCNKECQSKDWSNHKLLCKPVKKEI